MKRYSQPTDITVKLDPETLDKYFGENSKKSFVDTYRQLKRHGEILAGGYDELAALISMPPEDNIFIQSVNELESVGVLTPREQLSSIGTPFHSVVHDGQISVPVSPIPSAAPTDSTENQGRKFNFALADDSADSNTFITKVDISGGGSGGKAPGTDDDIIAAAHTAKDPGQLASIQEEGGKNNNDTDAGDSDGAGAAKPDGGLSSQEHVEGAAAGPPFHGSETSSVGSLDFSTISREQDDDDMSTVQTYSAASPRAIFLNGCLKAGVPPITLALVRKNLSTTINLAHMGIGDKVAHILAKCLSALPYLQVLNLSDNNLQDAGLADLLRSASMHHDIEVLDISSNIIGFESAQALADYLGNPKCLLKCLRMRDANIDDIECAHMVRVLMNNNHLQEFDLSKNIIGQDENLNTVQPDFVTGGESLATLLLHGSCPLEKLILHWNMIRLDGAVALCESIETNTVLTHLDLSYNAVARAGAEVLGHALIKNNTLRHLNIAHNHIDSMGCFTLCVGIADNKTLEMLILDGNPLGQLGGKMLAKTAASAGAQLKISAEHCDLTIKSVDTRFDSTDPCGSYELDLSAPYDRAVLIESLRLVADNPLTEIRCIEVFNAPSVAGSGSAAAAAAAAAGTGGAGAAGKKSGGSSSGGGGGGGAKGANWGAPVEVLYMNRVTKERLEFTPEEEKEIDELLSLSSIEDMHDDQIMAAIEKYDLESLDRVSIDALNAIMYELGVECSKETIAEIKAALDPFNQHFISTDQCMRYIRRRGENSIFQLNSLRRRNVLAAGTTPPPPPAQQRQQVDPADTNGQPPSTGTNTTPSHTAAAVTGFSDRPEYVPPTRGRIKMSITEGRSDLAGGPANRNIALPRINARRVVQAAENSSDSLSIILSAIETCGLYLEEAQMFFKHIYAKTDDAVLALSKLLPQMVSTEDGQTLIRNCLGYDMQKLRRLKQKLGPIYCPLVALYSGFYCIDFTKQLDRQCWKMLLSRSADIALNRKLAGLGELSQLGDGNTGFRNVIMKVPVEGGLATLFNADRVPKTGKVEFDFIDTVTHDDRSVHSVADDVFMEILHSAGLLMEDDLPKASARLVELQRAARKSILSMGNPYWRPEMGIAVAVGEHLHALYRSMDGRRRSVEIISKREVMEYQPADDPCRELHPQALSVRTRTMSWLTTATATSTSTSAHSERVSKIMDKFNATMLEKPRNIQLMTRAQLIKKLHAMMKEEHSSAEFKSVNLLEFLTSELRSVWVFCRQLSLLMELFVQGTVLHSSFGSYRVELIIALFDRIVDLHNFRFVLSELNAHEHAAILARIGILNIFDPCTPEGAYQLDLSRWDERQVVKMLVHLSAVEPGENWRNETYSFERSSQPIPGWELKVTWFASDGLPNKGLLTLEMYGGDGMNISDCQVDRTLRNMLTSVVLVRQRDLCAEIAHDHQGSNSAYHSRAGTADPQRGIVARPKYTVETTASATASTTNSSVSPLPTARVDGARTPPHTHTHAQQDVQGLGPTSPRRDSSSTVVTPRSSALSPRSSTASGPGPGSAEQRPESTEVIELGGATHEAAGGKHGHASRKIIMFGPAQEAADINSDGIADVTESGGHPTLRRLYSQLEVFRLYAIDVPHRNVRSVGAGAGAGAGQSPMMSHTPVGAGGAAGVSAASATITAAAKELQSSQTGPAVAKSRAVSPVPTRSGTPVPTAAAGAVGGGGSRSGTPTRQQQKQQRSPPAPGAGPGAGRITPPRRHGDAVSGAEAAAAGSGGTAMKYYRLQDLHTQLRDCTDITWTYYPSHKPIR